MNKNPLVSRYIAEAPTEQQKIMESIRAILHKEVVDLVENFKWSRPVFSTRGDFAYFQSNKSYLTFGFYKADKIKNHRQLLEGTGKEMRHFKIKSLEDCNQDILKIWIQETTSED